MRMRNLAIAGVLAAAAVIAGAGAASAAAPDGTFVFKGKTPNENASSIGTQSSQIKQNGQHVSGNGLSPYDQTTYPGSRSDLVQAALGH